MKKNLMTLWHLLGCIIQFFKGISAIAIGSKKCFISYFPFLFSARLCLFRGHEEHLSKILLEIIGSSEFLKRIKEDVEVPSLDTCCRQLLEDLKNASVFEVAFLHPQGSAEWMKERQLRITGSTCYEIYTYGRSNRNVDWESKSVKTFFPKSVTNKYVRHGLKFEKEALEVFRRQSNLEIITPCLIISELFPWLGFSPDGVIFEGDNPVASLEIKCPYTGKEHDPDDILKTCKIFGRYRPCQFENKAPILWTGSAGYGIAEFAQNSFDYIFSFFKILFKYSCLF